MTYLNKKIIKLIAKKIIYQNTVLVLSMYQGTITMPQIILAEIVS